jgi:serine/threonine-protein kinase RsbW
LNQRRPKPEARPVPLGWPPPRRLLAFRFRKWMPSSKRSLAEAAARARDLALHCGCDEEALADVEIAVREAMANAIWHGNGRRARSKVFFRCYGGPDAGIVIAVRDQGAGFDPESVPDPRNADRMELERGRGLFLMRALMDLVRYRRGGREVVLFQARRG